ncbi:DUF423 domain-containing protein [Lysobacter gummosus]|uniref:DUF423 domain-containing protein n=2 Tax=Lysobacter gummosus TaxID=262324 RepID=A0ABY3XHF7_9GAMM|nr:DUF423 domain-containing protein [Lysobacter gummosus]ALN90582.1 hypothetical protein LG3211_1606 [Lysobacter gummosus]UNP31080.1 DUF423 domain-containing protein [Lysobacter gummosus]
MNLPASESRNGRSPESPPLSARALVAAGALLAALAVALSAYAAHVADAHSQSRLQTAAVFAFGHGIALAALAPSARRALTRLALFAVLIGVAVFSGGLAAAYFLNTSTGLLPFGGSLLILAWLVYAADALRR